jgi:hypothetical protein
VYLRCRRFRALLGDLFTGIKVTDTQVGIVCMN